MGAQTSGLSRRQLLRVGAAPRLYAQYRGYFVKADFIAHGELILDVNTPAPHNLRVRNEGLLSRTLGRIGVVADHKTGDPAFDDQYIIDNATREQVAAFFTPEVIARIRRLEPFHLFALTHKEYRCQKLVDLDEYAPQDAAADLDALVEIVELTRQTGGATGAE